ncbi:MAG: dihydrofolate reductase family protein [Actinomycetota bacterium]|nr:dihydrofolate reductase family protein [Actinomycetota bacterium]
MILRPVHPEPGTPIEVGEPGTRDRLRELYRRAPGAHGIRLNLVASIDGSAQGDDGTSESLSSRADRAVLGAIRAESDVVLIGAATLRREGYLVPRTAKLAVLTASGDLGSPELGDVMDADKVIVLGPASVRDRVAASLTAPHRFIALTTDADGRVRLADVLAALADQGAPRILSEGGPMLAAALIADGLVGELCLSTSPRLTGGGLPVLGDMQHPAVDAQLAGLLVDDAGGVYARWLLPAGS